MYSQEKKILTVALGEVGYQDTMVFFRIFNDLNFSPYIYIMTTHNIDTTFDHLKISRVVLILCLSILKQHLVLILVL